VRVFVAGATGAIGRPLLPRLLAAGHEVTGMTRSEERAAAVRESGARAVVCDVFDEQALGTAMAEAAPEVVVHQLTSYPDRLDYRDADTFTATNRLRGEGTRILLGAAAAVGARRMVAQSVSFVDENPEPGRLGDVNKTILDMERAVTGSTELEGLVLRYGFFYGPGTVYGAQGSSTSDVRRRRFPVVGRGEWVYSFIHVDDAADATVAAVERGAPGVYDVVDDDPAAMRDWLPAFADAIGAKKPLRAPVWLARLVAGKEAVASGTRMEGGSNARARAELGWAPRWASWRQGFRDAPR
jgi:nucleoside-diphosphate-sugar epimerase